MINLNLLKVFHFVAKHKSVSRAAQLLYITQPAISNSLKKLQQEYKISLFSKESRSLQLTKEGERLFSYTQDLFEIVNKAELFLTRSSDSIKSTLKIALVTLYERHYVDEIISLMHSIDPTIQVSIYSGNSKNVVRMLEEGEVDIAVSSDVENVDTLKKVFYRKHNVLLCAPKGHPLYDKKSFCASMLENEKIIAKEKGSAVRHAVDYYLEKYQVHVLPTVELSNLDSIMDLCKTEKSLSFFPEVHQQNPLWNDADLAFLEDDEQSLSFSIYFYFHPLHKYNVTLSSVIPVLYDTLLKRSTE